MEAIRQWCASDFRHYVQYAMHRDSYNVEAVHDGLATYLQGTELRHQAKKKVVLGFRGFGKTYTCVRRYIEWRILRVPRTQVIVQSSTDRLAGAITQSLMETLRYDPIFEGLRPRSGTGTMAFSLEGIRMEKGEHVTCAGIKTSLTGSRANLYVFDDPEPDVQPEALYERIISAFQEAEFILQPVGHLWGGRPVPIPEQTQLLVIGQPHWPGTAYLPVQGAMVDGEEEPHPLRDAIFLRVPALRRVPLGTPGAIDDHPDDLKGQYAEISMMPGRFPTEVQIKKRNNRIIDPPTWRLQMDIDTSPIEGMGSVLKVSRLAQVHRDIAKAVRLTMTVDPADSEEGSEWGVAIGGMYGGVIHIFDILGFRSVIWDETSNMPGLEAWDQIFDNAEELGVTDIYLEKNYKAATQAAKRALRIRQERGAALRASFWEYAATQNKLHRICRSLEQPCNSGMVTFEPHVLEDGATFRQLAELRHTRLPKPNDRIDVLASLVSRFLELPAVTSPTANATRYTPSRSDPLLGTFGGMSADSPFAGLS